MGFWSDRADTVCVNLPATGPRRQERTDADSLVIAAVLIAAAVTAAPGVRETTYNCTVPDRGGVHPFVIEASATAVQLELSEATGNAVQLFGAFGPQGKTRGGLFSDSRFCRTTKMVAPLRTGLTRQPVITGQKTLGTAGGYECWSAMAITVHVRATLTGGRLTHAVVSVRSGAKQHPVAYADLTPKQRDVVWLSDGACHER